jgi:hypothetical protein
MVAIKEQTESYTGLYKSSFFLVSLGGVRLSPLGTSATVGLLYQPRMFDDDDYGAVGGMRIRRGNRSTRRKPAPVPLCPPQIPHNLYKSKVVPTFKCVRVVEVRLHAFLVFTLRGNEWSASYTGRFTTGDRSTGTHLAEV